MHMFQYIFSVSDLYLKYCVIGTITKDIYDHTLLLEGSASNDKPFFPQYNINYMLGYTNFYSKFIRLFRQQQHQWFRGLD